jgi:gliding motility-associated-like protein
MRIFLTIVTVVAFTTAIHSANISSNAVTGNWASPSSWAGGVVPGSGDSVIIVSGAQISLNTNAIVYKMTINTGGIFNLGNDTLTLAGNTTLGGNLVIYGTFSGNTGAVYLTGNFYCTGTFNSGTSAFNFNGNDAQSIGGATVPSFHHLISSNTNNLAGKGVALHPVNTIITGNFVANGVFARNSQSYPTATVTFNGTTQLSGIASFYLNHIVVNAGATLRGGNKTIYLYGNFSCSGTFVSETGTIDVRVDTYSSCQPDNQTIAIDNPSANPLFNLYINKTSGTVKPASIGTNTLGHLYVNNNFSVNSGTWNVDGTRQLWVGGNFTVNTTATFTASLGRLIMNGSSSNVQMLNSGGNHLYKLTINNSGAGVRLSINVTVDNELVLTNGILFTRNGALNNEIYLTNSDPVTSLPAGYSASSYIKGNLRRAVTAANYVFPVGVSNSSSSFYRPVTLNISALNGCSNVIICEDSIVNTGTYYASWWAKILPAGGNPSGTITFSYNVTADFISGMNECGIMASRGTLSPQVSWNYVLQSTGTASGGNLSVNMPADFSPYAFMLGEPMPVVSGATICSGNTTLLTITSPGGFGSFNWYSVQSGGTTLATSSNTFTTPALTATTTYWTAYNGTPCEAHRWPVTVTVNPIPTSAFTVSSAACYNSPVTVTYSGTASPAATYTWNFGGGSASPGSGQGPHSVSYSAPGTYPVTLTVTENSCVSSVTSVNAQVPTQIQVSATVNNSTCGGANGSVSLNVTGGWGNYSYGWSNSQTTPSIANLTAGNYLVTVTDIGGCTFTGSYAVSNQGAPSVTATVVNNASCYGFSDGQVTFSATGAGPMSYIWSNGVNGNGNPVNITTDTLQAGTYNYTVTDANTCISSGSFTITQPGQMVISSNNTQPLCYGQNNGTISLTTTGGTGTYSYNWAHGSSQPSQVNMAAGSYSVTVTDQNLCTASEIITLTEPDTIIISIVTSPISCFGESDGVISAGVTGGTSPYTYSWTGGYTTETITSAGNGTYNLSILDQNNCAASTSVTLTQPDPLDVIMNPMNTPCYGTPGGMVMLNVTGGTSPYAFAWNNGAATQDVTDLYAGIYWVTVTDDHGCTSVGSTGIQQPDSVMVTITTSSLLCHGNQNGSVQTFVSGGVSPYQYLWNTSATSSSLQNLSGGTYTVTITDSNGCSSVYNSYVNEPSQITANPVPQPASCYGLMDGQISAGVSGGTPGYEILWSNGDNGNNITSLPAGAYSFTVTDQNDCYASFTAGVSQPDSLFATTSFSSSICWGDSSGFITVTAYGGTSPYTWTWNTGSTLSSLTGLAPGTYTCLITDAHSCSTSHTVTMGSSSPIVISLTPDYNSGTLLAATSGGTPPYSFTWDNGSSDSLLTGIQSGFYSVTVSDANGCTSETALTLFYSLEIPTAITPNDDGFNDTWEIKGIGAYEEVTIEIFNRWGDNIFNYSGTGTGYADKTRQWNGLHNGNNMPTGVYLYIVKISGVNDPFQGTITLIR